MEQKFRKVVTIFIDILGSQNRESFNEWYNVMRIFSTMVEREKELDKTHKWTVYKRETHVFSDCAYIIYDYKDNIEDNRKDIYELILNSQKKLSLHHSCFLEWLRIRLFNDLSPKKY